MAAGADSRGYKRLRQDGRPHRRERRRADVQVLRRPGGRLGLRAVEAHARWHADPRRRWTTLPDTGGLTTTDTGDSCAEGLASGSDAPHPFLLHYWNADCEPDGQHGHWNAFTGSTGGWKDWTVDLSAVRRQAGGAVRSRYITDWGTLGLGTWVDDAKVDGRRRRRSSRPTSRPTRAAGTSPHRPEGSDELDDANWTRAAQEFRRAASSGRRHRLHGVRVRGHERGGAAGVHEARPAAPGRGQGQPRAGQPRPGPAGRQLAGTRSRRARSSRSASGCAPTASGA